MKNINIKIKNESDLYEKYGNNISLELINYLIKKIKYEEDNIKIIIDTDLKIENINVIIKRGVSNYYNEIKKIDKVHNDKQILFFIIGLIFLLFSTFIDYKVVQEIVLIAGWVAIWEVIDIALNVDIESRLNKKTCKKILKSEIVIK